MPDTSPPVAGNPDLETDPLSRLQRRWWLVAAVYLLAILTSFALLVGAAWPGAGQWVGQTAVLALYSLWIIRRHLPENRRDGEAAVLPRFGWGNRLTILRGLLISMVAGFLFIPWPAGWLAWVPALLYTTADIADYLDGYAARRTNHATALGERLDMEFDGLGLLVVTLLAVWYAQLPWWYLLIGLARYFFVFGLWLRQRRGLSLQPMPHSQHRRIFAGFQMGFMSVVLWPIVPAVLATITGTIFALATGASFLRDWLVIVGRLNPATDAYRLWQRHIYRFFSRWLPPVLRMILAAALIALVRSMAQPLQPESWVTLFTSWQLPGAAALATFFAVLGLLTAPLVVFGVAGRLMTLPLLFPLGFDMAANGATWPSATAVAGCVAITLLGTGAWSLWQPEERFMVRRAGEASL